MKLNTKIIAAFALLLICSGLNASAFDLNSILGGLGGAKKDNTTENSSKADDILGLIGGIVNNSVASSNFTIDDLIGTWKYSSPAVSFKSDDALKNLGGAAAATTIENKIAPYYIKFRLTDTELTVDDQHNFSMKILKYGTLKGRIEKDEEGFLVFNFNIFGKINLGKVKANATKVGSELNLTFDIKRLIDVLQKVAEVAKNNTFKSAANLITSYDGIYIGFKLRQQNL